jgi:hypothetical protein
MGGNLVLVVAEHLGTGRLDNRRPGAYIGVHVYFWGMV